MKSWKYFVIIYDTPSSSCDIYTHYIQCGGTLLCIRSSLLCEPVSLRVVMRLVHATDKTWYTFLYHNTMYVISLSNISMNTNFKQIARVELKCVQYKIGSHDMKQTDSSIIIVRNVCVLTKHPWLFNFSSRGYDRQSSEQNNRKSPQQWRGR